MIKYNGKDLVQMHQEMQWENWRTVFIGNDILIICFKCLLGNRER